MRHELQSQVDGSLRSTARRSRTNRRGRHTRAEARRQLRRSHRSSGAITGSARPKRSCPIDRAGARGRRGHDAASTATRPLQLERRRSYREIALRDRARSLGTLDGGAVLVVRPLDDMDRALDRLRLSCSSSRSARSRSPRRPVRSSSRRDPRAGTPSHSCCRANRRDGRAERARARGGRDELARLGASFNTMLASLEESLETQRRFVADASHELRTPLTSLQTNIDVLRGDIELDAGAAPAAARRSPPRVAGDARR